MWIGSIKLRVQTKNVNNAGTDDDVTASIVRDGNKLWSGIFDYPAEDDLERGALRDYNYLHLPRHNDKTPQLPPGIGQNPMPYPDYGIEFSNGLQNHLKIKIQIFDDDMWIKDKIEVYIKEIRRVPTSFDTLEWQDDSNWSLIGSWGQDRAFSTDSDEGITSLNLDLFSA